MMLSTVFLRDMKLISSYISRFPLTWNQQSQEKKDSKHGRAWKLELIEKMNPTWKDLFEEVI